MDPLLWSGAELERALAVIAPLYELDFGGLAADAAMWGEVIADGSRVLELGAGTGRLALPLALSGCAVTAVDASESMLAVGEERMRAAGVEVVRGDMRCLRAEALAGSFDAVLLGLSTFQHLLRRTEQLAVLRLARECLAAGGHVLLDWTAPRADDVEPSSGALELQWMRQNEAGEWVTKSAGQELALARAAGSALDRAAAVAWVTYQYDTVQASPEGDGLVRRALARFPLRVNLTAGEMAGLLAEAGLRGVEWYGDWDFAPPGAGERLIVIAEAVS